MCDGAQPQEPHIASAGAVPTDVRPGAGAGYAGRARQLAGAGGGAVGDAGRDAPRAPRTHIQIRQTSGQSSGTFLGDPGLRSGGEGKLEKFDQNCWGREHFCRGSGAPCSLDMYIYICVCVCVGVCVGVCVLGLGLGFGLLSLGHATLGLKGCQDPHLRMKRCEPI